MKTSMKTHKAWLFAAAVSILSLAAATSPARAENSGLLGNTLGNVTNSVTSLTSNLSGNFNGSANNAGASASSGLVNSLTGTVSSVTGSVTNAANLNGNANRNGGNLITAVTNTVNTTAGDIATVDLKGDGLVDVAVDKRTASAIAKSQNAVSVQSGVIGLDTASADHVLDAAINVDGVNKASSARVASNGAIVLGN